MKPSRTTVNTILLEADILSPKAHRSTKRRMTTRLEQELKEVASINEETKITEKIIALENAPTE